MAADACRARQRSKYSGKIAAFLALVLVLMILVESRGVVDANVGIFSAEGIVFGLEPMLGGYDDGGHSDKPKRKKKDKRRRTFELFGKNTARGLRHIVSRQEAGKFKNQCNKQQQENQQLKQAKTIHDEPSSSKNKGGKNTSNKNKNK
mmetsp:Transcript_18573/g.33271  ORF Transcript_18573/g.33271 Transcript_18573/m.33271 type:complete len:148 (-) Transcript_18573:436-879(-)